MRHKNLKKAIHELRALGANVAPNEDIKQYARNIILYIKTIEEDVAKYNLDEKKKPEKEQHTLALSTSQIMIDTLHGIAKEGLHPKDRQAFFDLCDWLDKFLVYLVEILHHLDKTMPVVLMREREQKVLAKKQYKLAEEHVATTKDEIKIVKDLKKEFRL